MNRSRCCLGYGTQEPLVDITQWTILGVFFQSFEKHCGCLLLSMPQTLSPYVKVSAQGVPLVRDGNEITSNFGVKCQKTLFRGRGVNTRFQAKGLQY